jgi:CheY-like chemotaxis protein
MDRRIAGGLLEKQPDWHVAYAKDGQEALDMLEKSQPDLIVTDLQMPELNGLELVQEVRRSYPLVPVILMTAQGSEQIAVKALESGAASYVPKVRLSEELASIADRVLSLSGERRTQRVLMQRMESMKARFVLNSEPRLLTSLVGHLQRTLNDMGLFSESDRLRVGVALEEALLNAAYHGNLEISSELREQDHSAYYDLARERTQIAPFASRSIFVDVDFSRNHVEYVIQDEGPGFDPSKLPDPTDPVNLERPCGRGLLLMRTFMDHVRYNKSGNQVTMSKRVTEPVSAGAA